jgi:hypothetical protein
MMAGAESELQTAIHAALTADAALQAKLGGAKVFDQTPPRVEMPFITYGKLTSLDWSTSSDEGEEINFQIEIWSAGKGKAEAAAIASQVRSVIDALTCPDGDFHLVLIAFVSAETEFQDEAAAYRCLLQYRALMERA